MGEERMHAKAILAERMFEITKEMDFCLIFSKRRHINDPYERKCR